MEKANGNATNERQESYNGYWTSIEEDAGKIRKLKCETFKIQST